MDIDIRPVCADTWQLLDLLQRPVGRIVRTRRGLFVEPDGGPLAGIGPEPFPTLDAAVTAIASTTQGKCRLPTIKR